MFNTSFFQILILIFLLFILFGDFKFFLNNFANVKTFFKKVIKKDKKSS